MLLIKNSYLYLINLKTKKMKRSILVLFIAGLSLTSCLKSKTCTCKNSSGTVVSQETRKSNKSGLKEFEEECSKKKYETKTNGVVTSSIPCELS